MTNAVIYGITGQSGSYLAELLLDKGYSVIGVARRTSTPSDERIRHLRSNERLTLVEGDVTDPFSVNRILNKVQPFLVFNLSAQSHVKTSFDDAVHTTIATYVGCLNILETIRSSSALIKSVRFYQASSSEMFGSACSAYTSQSWTDPGGARVDFQSRPFGLAASHYENWFQDELTPMLPCSPYAIAKLAAHHAVRLYREAYGLHASSGILFNHESPRRGDEFVTRKITKYVAKWAHAQRAGLQIEKLRLGNLKSSRDWGFAGDYVEAMLLMLERDKPDDYVVSTGETHTVEEFLLAAFSTIGLQATHLGDLPVEIDQAYYRPSEVGYLRGNASKARRTLGWRPKTTFSELVAMMVMFDMEMYAND